MESKVFDLLLSITSEQARGSVRPRRIVAYFCDNELLFIIMFEDSHYVQTWTWCSHLKLILLLPILPRFNFKHGSVNVYGLYAYSQGYSTCWNFIHVQLLAFFILLISPWSLAQPLSTRLLLHANIIFNYLRSCPNVSRWTTCAGIGWSCPNAAFNRGTRRCRPWNRFCIGLGLMQDSFPLNLIPDFAHCIC